MFSRLSPSARSLHAQAILRIVLPLSLILAGLVMGGAYAYYHTVTSLIIERHHRLASLAAASVSDVIMGYANVLEALASKNGLQSQFPEERVEALREVEGVLEIFDAGVIIVVSRSLGILPPSLKDCSVYWL